jgi:hypothetical protein
MARYFKFLSQFYGFHVTHLRNLPKLDNSESCQSVVEFVYLESIVRKQNNIHADIKRRLNLADAV